MDDPFVAAFRSGFGNIMNVCRCEYVSTSPQMRPEGITCRRKLQNAAPLPASCPKEPLILTLSPKLYWLQLWSRQILSASVVSWHLQGRPFNEGALGAAVGFLISPGCLVCPWTWLFLFASGDGSEALRHGSRPGKLCWWWATRTP